MIKKFLKNHGVQKEFQKSYERIEKEFLIALKTILTKKFLEIQTSEIGNANSEKKFILKFLKIIKI